MFVRNILIFTIVLMCAKCKRILPADGDGWLGWLVGKAEAGPVNIGTFKMPNC